MFFISFAILVFWYSETEMKYNLPYDYHNLSKEEQQQALIEIPNDVKMRLIMNILFMLLCFTCATL